MGIGVFSAPISIINRQIAQNRESVRKVTGCWKWVLVGQDQETDIIFLFLCNIWLQFVVDVFTSVILQQNLSIDTFVLSINLIEV